MDLTIFFTAPVNYKYNTVQVNRPGKYINEHALRGY